MAGMLYDIQPQVIEFETLDTDDSSVTAYDWTNSKNTAGCSCDCGTYKAHWLSYSNRPWPARCSVAGCNHAATQGARIANLDVRGERIAPMCESCSEQRGRFDLKEGISLPEAGDTDKCGLVEA